MPKYIKREIADLNGKGTTQAYYQMKSEGCLTTDRFLNECAKRGGLQHSTLAGALMMIADELAFQIAKGYTVRLEGIGTFGGKLGVRDDKEQDTFVEGEQRRNAVTVEVKGVSFRADKELVWQVQKQCHLERGKDSRLVKTQSTLEERIEQAKKYLAKWNKMRVADYAEITGLASSTAAKELRKVDGDPAYGIVSDGRRSAKVYVLAHHDASGEESLHRPFTSH